jgi:hypothetical protein
MATRWLLATGMAILSQIEEGENATTVNVPGVGCGLFWVGSHLHQRRVKWAGLGEIDKPGESHAAIGCAGW